MMVNILKILSAGIVTFFLLVLAFGPYVTGLMEKRDKGEMK
jgi:hypothetical protein